jgi:L-alanine-DL-glutamate epimerase-like enolase superfamily enzyme
MVDVNQGWNIKEQALEMAHWLKERGVILLEQPLPKEKQKDLEWLSKRSPLPIIADEGIKRMDELQKYWGLYNGINVKLMKSTGLREAKKMLEFTKRQGLITMIGCMTESSCGVAAASHLSPLCQFADLDGPFLTKNNPFEDLIVKNGRLQIPYKPGIGVDIKHILGQ